MANENSYNRRDANLEETKALPADAGAGNATSIDAFDLGSAHEAFLAPCELELEAPALGTTPLPDGTEIHYDVEDSADDSSYAVIAADVIVQTGAGGAGAAAATERFRLPSNVRRYVRVTAEGDDGTGTLGDCSGSSMTARIVT